MIKRPKKLTRIEKILKAAREKPSPTCNEPKQVDLFDYDKQQGFAKLDEAIRAITQEGRR
jgi:hypothetical protein